MAYSLTETDRANIRHAVNLLESFPASQGYMARWNEDVALSLSKVAVASGFSTSGAFLESINLRPISTLLDFTAFIGFDNQIYFQVASDQMKLSDAPQIPLDASVIQTMTQAVGAFATPLQFQQALQKTPFSTLTNFLDYAGSGITVFNGDPPLFDGTYFYALGGEQLPGTDTVRLTWTYPGFVFALGVGGGLWLQRSTSASNWPLQPAYSAFHDYNPQAPAADPNWETLAEWHGTGNPLEPLSSLPTTYDITIPASPNTTYYRLVASVAGIVGPDPSSFELDWNVLPITRVVTGATEWYKDFGGTGQDATIASVTDASGNVYSTGYFSNTVDFTGNGTGTPDVTILTALGTKDIFIAKRSASGTLTWVVRYGKAGANQILPETIGIDSTGKIVVGGGFYGTANLGGTDKVSTGDLDAFLAQYTTLGAHIWSLGFGGTLPDKISSLGIGTDNSIAVAGFFQGACTINGTSGTATINSYGSGIDVLMVKFTSAGALSFAKNFYNAGTEYGTKILVDLSNRIYLFGYYNGYINFLDSSSSGPFYLNTQGGYVARFAGDGTPQWAKSYGNPNTRFWSACFDTVFNIFVTGDFTGTTNVGGGNMTSVSWGLDLFLFRISSIDGGYHLQTQIPGFQATVGRALSVAVDSAGYPWLAGYFQGQYSFGGKSVMSPGGVQRGFVAKYNLSADHPAVWAIAGADTPGASGPGSTSASFFTLCSSPGPAAIVSGWFSGDMTLNGNVLTGSGSIDALTVKLV